MSKWKITLDSLALFVSPAAWATAGYLPQTQTDDHPAFIPRRGQKHSTAGEEIGRVAFERAGHIELSHGQIRQNVRQLVVCPICAILLACSPVTDIADTDPARTWFMLAVLGYGVSAIYSVFLWRKGFQRDDRVNYCLLGFSLAAHTTAMILRGFSLSRCPVNNLFEAMMFVMWTISASFLIIGISRKFRFIGAFISPVLLAMGVFALMPALDQPPGANVSKLASIHAALILLSYGAFGLGSAAALMYLTEERDLKTRRMRTILSLLPPIQRLELVATRLLVAGLVLLTAGLSMAPFLMKQQFGVFFQQDAKVLWSVFVWLLYAGLLAMRWWFSQGGRKFAWGAVGSFSFVLLTFWGVNLLSRAHQP
jgi:ABC-type transport system involved in cytochrome c biogenesis permease subunit